MEGSFKPHPWTDAGSRAECHYLSIRASDSFGREKQLRDQAASIIAALGQFLNLVPETLANARSIINAFLERSKPLIGEISGSTPEIRQEQAWAVLIMLAAIEVEISYVLADAHSPATISVPDD